MTDTIDTNAQVLGIVEILAFAPRNCRFRGYETAGQRPRRGTMLATGLGPCPGAVIAADWGDYDRLLALFDAGAGPEPEGPHVVDPPGWVERCIHRDAVRLERLRARLLNEAVVAMLRGDRSARSTLVAVSLVGKGVQHENRGDHDGDPFDDGDDDEPVEELVDARPGAGACFDLIELLLAGLIPAMQPEINQLLERVAAGRALHGGTSERTARRRRQQRSQGAKALARDGRRTSAAIAEAVAAGRSSLGLHVKHCAWCGAVFEAKRSDAVYCAEHRKPDQRKATPKYRKSGHKRPAQRARAGTMLATEVGRSVVDVDTGGRT